MFRRKRRYPPPTQPSPRVVLTRILGMEKLVANIADLTAAVNALVTVEQQVLDALNAQPQPPTSTVLTADDQAALDAAVQTVQSVSATLSAALPVAAPAPAPVVAPSETPTATDTGAAGSGSPTA